MPPGRFTAILRGLTEGGVEFILVGGLAAVVNGAPLHTFDVDVVHSRSPENVQRLLAVLNSPDAIFRIQPERRLRPTTDHLTGFGHSNLTTRFGPLDVLATIGDDLTHDALLPQSPHPSSHTRREAPPGNRELSVLSLINGGL